MTMHFHRDHVIKADSNDVWAVLGRTTILMITRMNIPTGMGIRTVTHMIILTIMAIIIRPIHMPIIRLVR